MKPTKAILIASFFILLIDLVAWSNLHFHLTNFDTFYTQIVCYLLIATILGIYTKTTLLKKMLLMVGIAIGALLSWLVLGYAMMSIIPGYKERDWIIYRVCLPALEKYHKDKKDDPLKNALYERSTCLQNVWNNKDPLDGIRK